MKKSLISLLVVALVGSALTAPALAGKKKKGKKAKPVATTLFLHGTDPVGDAGIANSVTGTPNNKMDTTEPSESYPKSMSYGFVAGNEQCTGNPLFPSWEGQLVGTVTGDVKLIGHFVGAPGKAVARIWADVPFSSCTSGTTGAQDFVEPLSTVEFDVPPGGGEVEIVFENLKFDVGFNMIVEIHRASAASQGRVLYDSPDFPSRVEFDCVPAKGAKACA